MITNPFILTGDIPEPYFCDRQEETKRLITAITGGENICMVSPRRMGKSKLVKHCYRQTPLCEDYYCFYIDLLHTASLRDFAFAFGKCVFEALQPMGEKVAMEFLRVVKSLTASFTLDPISGMPQLSLSLSDNIAPEFTFENIFRYLENADKPCVVCFDEFQQIANYQEKNVEALLRGYIQHLGNTHFVYSGSERHMLYEMFGAHTRPFYRSTGFIELNAIALDKYTEFVQYWFQQYNKTIDAELIALIYSVAEGNTFALQKICHELFAALQENETANRELLQTVVNNIIETESSRYERMLSHIPARQQELLKAIAQENRVEKIMSGQFIRKYGLSSSSSVQNAIKRLLDMDLVTLDNKQYFIDDIFFRMYLRRISH